MARPFQFDKDIVLNKAMLLFWENGYSNTSFEIIIERLKLSRSSVYNSFGDKRTLFIESLKLYINKQSKSLITFLNELSPTQESIRKLLQQVVYANLSGKYPKGCLVVNTAIEFANHDKEVRQIIENNVNEVVSAFTYFIMEGQKKGSINNLINAEALAIGLFHQITALRVTGKTLSDKSFFDTAIHTFIQLFTKS